ncbi:MAG: PKD domain-containing protein [bacterium]|nr:PKD domain-containing protein [bacterium]
MQVIVISTPSPIANFTISGSTVSPATLTLTNSSQNADRYFWDFGDNRTSTITNPNVTYERAGVYAITLTAFQTSTGKSHKFTRSVQITPSKVSIRGVYFQKIPFTTGYGAGWDIDSGPDLFYEISVGNSVLASSSVKYELTPSHLPLFIPLKEPCVLSDWNQNYEIKIYDLDKFSNSDCLCVVGFVVNELNRLNDYPTEAPIQNRFANLILTLEWW